MLILFPAGPDPALRAALETMAMEASSSILPLDCLCIHRHVAGSGEDAEHLSVVVSGDQGIDVGIGGAIHRLVLGGGDGLGLVQHIAGHHDVIPAVMVMAAPIWMAATPWPGPESESILPST